MNYKLTFVYILLALLIFSALIKDRVHRLRAESDSSAMPIDFPVYYVAGSLAHRGTELYFVPPHRDPAVLPYFVLLNVNSASDSGREAERLGFGAVCPFIYPPFAALVMRPLTAFSPRMALLYWRILVAVLTALSAYCIVATFSPRFAWRSSGLAIAGAFLFFPFVETIALGQASAIILACWAVGIYLASHRRFILSALFFAFGTLIKISPVLAIGVFVLKRQWKWVLAYAAWFLTLSSVSVSLLGWAPHLIYLRTVLPVLSCGIPVTWNKSLAGLIQSMTIGDVVGFGEFRALPLVAGACVAAKALAAILYFGLLWFFHRRRGDQTVLGSELAAVALLSLLISPVSWRHHYLLALIPLIYLWLPETRLKPWQLIVLTVATLIIGTPLIDYATYSVHGTARLLANALEPLATLIVLGLVMVTIPRPISPSLPPSYAGTATPGSELITPEVNRSS
jgi:hypothetical protein